MGFTVGIPALKLKRNYKGKSKNAGDLRKIIEEMYDRYGKDSDIDPTKKHLNMFFGRFKSSEEAYNFFVERAENYKIPVTGKKTGKFYHNRKLRSDAVLAGNLIAKPSMEYVNDLPKKEQIRLNKDLADCLKSVLDKHNITYDAHVVHYDEVSPHLHMLFHDEDFKLGKKMNQKFIGDLNRDIPQMMREKGWPCDDLDLYDPGDREGEELEEYKRSRRSKKHGKSSLDYKREKLSEKERDLEEKRLNLNKIIEEEVQKRLQIERQELEQLRNSIRIEAEELDSMNLDKELLKTAKYKEINMNNEKVTIYEVLEMFTKKRKSNIPDRYKNYVNQAMNDYSKSDNEPEF